MPSSNGDQWWLEFWEASDDPDASPVKEMTLASIQDALAAAMQWLGERWPEMP